MYNTQHKGSQYRSDDRPTLLFPVCLLLSLFDDRFGISRRILFRFFSAQKVRMQYLSQQPHGIQIRLPLAPLPIGDCISGHMNSLGQLFLRHAGRFPRGGQLLTESCHIVSGLLL